MNRRKFIGAVAGAAGLSTAALACPKCQQGAPVPHPNLPPEGPYSIEIVSPPEDAVRELPLFDSYKQAENFAHARMQLLRSNAPHWSPPSVPHEAGHIKVWASNGQVVYECAWGETWTMATSYVDCRGRLS
tara:strand:- start:222 stop:614 length:393 start_codon:yes stop_codon:yes gene_type:complete